MTHRRSSSSVVPSALASSSNPFGLRAKGTLPEAFRSSAAVPAGSHGGGAYYAVVAGAPSTGALDVDSTSPAVEVRVSWGAHDVLEVSHLAPPRDFVVGEVEGTERPDFELERGLLDGTNVRLVRVDSDGRLFVVAPASARVRVTTETSEIGHASLLGSRLHVSPVEAGRFELELGEDETVIVDVGALSFAVRRVRAARSVLAPPVRADRTLLAFTGGVAALVAGALVALSALAPNAASLTGEAIRLDDRYVQALIQARQEEPSPARPAPVSEGEASPTDASGTAGTSNPAAASHAAHGPAAEGGSPTRPTTLASATTTLILSTVTDIATQLTGGANVYGPDSVAASDTWGALTNLVGSTMPFGDPNAIGLRGPGASIGFDDGERHTGVLDGVHLSDRTGTCDDRDCGLEERQHVNVPVPTPVITEDSGLDAGSIRRVIQRHVAEVQHCYEQGLQRNPSLEGRVTVSFSIAPTGAVTSSSAQDGVGDATVSTCVAGAVRRWSFPASDDGAPTSVRFPFNLSQSGR